MKSSYKAPVIERQYILPFILVSSCFMLWGIANHLTDPLVKVFKSVFVEISTFQASLIQFAFYFGYFCMAIPGALISKKYSYKTGILVGLGLYALGCGLLYPSTLSQQFLPFCLSYYILACGLGILETNANPYILALGPEETATRRLNHAQSFNPIGAISGIVLCQILILAKLPLDSNGEISILPAQIHESLSTIIFPYLSVAAILLVIWILFAITKMPKGSLENEELNFKQTFTKLSKSKNYVYAVLAQFFYVGAQISVWTFTIFYIPAQMKVTPSETMKYHTLALVLFGISRWVFTALMEKFKDYNLLLLTSVAAIILSLGVIFAGGFVGVVALIGISACMSLMFPTIFGMGSEGLSGNERKVASSGLIMAILGGALITPLQGAIIDAANVNISYLIPFVCFVVIASYAFYKKKLAISPGNSER
jgi:FHS family L-fucose permease-like MFS transporter